ncbi:MAG: ABC-F family ATP-binding cassette domain-containing protein [Alphaproteobacteria bacterium]
MLDVRDPVCRIGGRTLIEGGRFQIEAGRKVGLIGPNGAGKTTFLRLLLGQRSLDGGEIRLNSGATIGTVAQEAPGGDQTPIEAVIAADTERSSLLEELAALEASGSSDTRIADIHTRLADIDAWGAEARAARILAGLGFDQAAQQWPLSSYSGGWRMRVALASVLFRAPDLLLLDEPTNHLDLEAAIWLEGYLKRYPRAVLLVSHDRGLLNRVPEAILALDARQLTLFRGNFDQWEERRQMQIELAQKAAVKQEAKRAHMQAFVDRFRYKASKARQAQSRLKMLEKLRPIDIPEAQRAAMSLRFPEPSTLPPPVIALERASVGYELGKPILQRLNLRLDMEDRVALLGQNGNGKSTLAKLLVGLLETETGRLSRGAGLKVGYFSQDQADSLGLEARLIDFMAEQRRDMLPEKIRAHLGRYGFPGDRAETVIGHLSGGEKARAVFAMITLDAPHLLILDEPTNHLDMASRDQLIQAVAEFPGAVILISHDQHIIAHTADRLWLVADGTVTVYEDDLDSYAKDIVSRRTVSPDGDKAEKAEASPAGGRRGDRRAAAELRKKLAPLQKACETARQRVEKLTEARTLLEQALADPGLYERAPDKVADLTRQMGEIDQKLTRAEDAWLEAEEELELAQG